MVKNWYRTFEINDPAWWIYHQKYIDAADTYYELEEREEREEQASK